MNIILIFGINNEVGKGHHTFLTFKGKKMQKIS